MKSTNSVQTELLVPRLEEAELDPLIIIVKKVIKDTLRIELASLTQTDLPISQKETAKLLGVSEQTLITWRKQNLLIGHPIGKRVYYYPEEINEAIKNGNVRPKTKKACHTK